MQHAAAEETHKGVFGDNQSTAQTSGLLKTLASTWTYIEIDLMCVRFSRCLSGNVQSSRMRTTPMVIYSRFS